MLIDLNFFAEGGKAFRNLHSLKKIGNFPYIRDLESKYFLVRDLADND